MGREFMLSQSGSRVDMNNDRNQASAGRAFMETAGGASATPSVDCGGVLPQDPTRQRAIASRTKTVVLLVLVCSVAAFVGTRFLDSLQGTDFPDFYCAARMLADGHGHQLYDAEAQRQYQARYAGRVGTLYIHPPFEAALYLAVAWLPLGRAYLLWSFLNLAFLAVSAHRLAREALRPWDWRLLLAASLTFAPLLLCLLQGQDSLLLLLLVILAFTALRRDSAFAAGCWLGLGLFKFQIVLPLLLVLVLTQPRSARSQLAKGFGLVGLALAGLSAAISGWSAFTVYPTFLLHLGAQPFAGIVPQAMANFRGLTYFFFQRDQSLWAVVVVSMLSVTALAMAVTGWNEVHVPSHLSPAASMQNHFDLLFANCVVFALLVSYHLNPHDLSLLLLPMVLMLRHSAGASPLVTGSPRSLILGLSAVLFLPPLHLFALQAHAYALVSVPLIALFAVCASWLRRGARKAGTAPLS
jgi:hypothetical protein